MGEGKTGRLIVHTGDPKTGTTSIQEALATGRVTLPGKTLFYPSRLNHNPLASQIARQLPLAETTLPGLTRRIGEAGADVTILSGEVFEAVFPGRMLEMRTDYLAQVSDDIVFVRYVRPHPGRILSSFTENIKTGYFQGDLHSFFQEAKAAKRFHYAPRLQKLRQMLGSAHILRPMIRSELHKGDVVEDFLCTALGPDAYTIAAGSAANESVGLRDLMVLKLVFRLLQDRPKLTRLHLGWLMARFLNAQTSAPQDKLTLHRSLALQIADTYRKDAKAVDQARFDGRPLLQTELDRAVDTAPLEAQSLEPEDYISPTERRSIEALAKSIDLLLGTPGKVAAHLFEERLRVLHGA